MPQVSGLAAFLGTSDLRPLLEQALKSMGHRARAGYCVEGEVLQEVGDLSQTQNIYPCTAIGGCLMKTPVTRYETFLHGSIYHPSAFDLDSRIARMIGAEDPFGLASELASVDGSYAFIYPSDDGLIIGRDPLGVKPLYSARKGHVFGVASEMKALVSAGFEDIERVAPGHIHHVHLHSQESYQLRNWDKADQLQVGLDEASTIVLELLKESVKHRISGKKKVGIGFSGGLDSSLIALISSCLTDVDLITICTKDSQDLIEAEKVAKQLGLNLDIQIVDKDLANVILKDLPHLIESRRIMDLSIGLAVYLAAEKAYDKACETLMLGQMADELFGGYARYLRLCEEQGWNSVSEALLRDVSTAHRMNFERDDKASSPFVQLDLPYASIRLVDYAIRLSPKLKIDPLQNVRKIVLRMAAVRAGLSEEIASKAKKAVQFSSGLQKMVNSLHN